MTATPFDLDAPLGHRCAIIRRDADGVEMVELAWGASAGTERRPSFHRRACRGPDLSDPPLSRAGVGVSPAQPRPSLQLFPGRRRLVLFRGHLAASETGLAGGLCDPDGRGKWGRHPLSRPADGGAEARERLDWLDGLVAEDELLRPLPAGSFRVREDRRAKPLQHRRLEGPFHRAARGGVFGVAGAVRAAAAAEAVPLTQRPLRRLRKIIESLDLGEGFLRTGRRCRSLA